METEQMFRVKGQMGGSVAANLIGLTIGIGVTILVLIFVSVLGAKVFNSVENDINTIGTDYYTQNFTAVNGTAKTLAHPILYSDFAAVNATGGNIVNPSNYTLGTQTFTLKQGTIWASKQINATYLYSVDSTIRESVQGGIQNSFDSIQETGSLMPIIVLAVMIFLVLSLVLGFTALGGGGSKGSVL